MEKLNRRTILGRMLLILIAVVANICAMAQQVPIIDSTKTVYRVTERVPAYPGGDAGMKKVLEENLEYPGEAMKKRIEGRVVVSFVVDTTGSVTDIQIVNSVDETIDREAMRLVSLLGKFTPAMQNDKKVRYRYLVPINFKHNLPEKTRKPKNQKK